LPKTSKSLREKVTNLSGNLDRSEKAFANTSFRKAFGESGVLKKFIEKVHFKVRERDGFPFFYFEQAMISAWDVLCSWQFYSGVNIVPNVTRIGRGCPENRRETHVKCGGD